MAIISTGQTPLVNLNDGSQGPQGPQGPSGQPTYTWVKYAIDAYGGNMSDTPDGKRYVGFAFNKTTQTKSTNASDYQWSPLYDNVIVGGRNLFKGYTDAEITLNPYQSVGSFTQFPNLTFDPAEYIGRQFTVSFYAKSPNGVTSLAVYNTNSNPRYFYFNKTLDSALGAEWKYYTYTFTNTDRGATYTQSDKIEIYAANQMGVLVKKIKVEMGNVATDWTPAPEDIKSDIDNKATGSDLDALAGSVSLISSQLNGKTDYGEFKAMKEDYDAFIAQNIVDSAAVSESLSTMDGRVALAETLVGNAKLVTDFVSTVITESEEGIYISNGASNTGILIATDRISFMDNNTEVAYISNQTMQINHGIFVESAIISDFKFEKIPGTTILAITWVGD